MLYTSTIPSAPGLASTAFTTSASLGTNTTGAVDLRLTSVKIALPSSAPTPITRSITNFIAGWLGSRGTSITFRPVGHIADLPLNIFPSSARVIARTVFEGWTITAKSVANAPAATLISSALTIKKRFRIGVSLPALNLASGWASEARLKSKIAFRYRQRSPHQELGVELGTSTQLRLS